MYRLNVDTFCTIQELIQHHLENNVPVQAAPEILLKNPAQKTLQDKDHFLYEYDDIELGTKLNSADGFFGAIYQGVIKSTNASVAVKTCVERKNSRKFLEEADIMKTCQHANLVGLIGICKVKEPHYICK